MGDVFICIKDIKIDILNIDSVHCQQYLDMLTALSLHQLINQPTRVTNTSTTSDHIIASHAYIVGNKGVNLHHGIFYHGIIFCDPPLHVKNNVPKYLKYQILIKTCSWSISVWHHCI